MAKTVGTNYWLTYAGVGEAVGSGVKEDLLDLVTMIDPWDTPFFSACPKSTAKSVTHEWMYDTLAATSIASATIGALEGADFEGNALTQRTRQLNYCQIFRKDIAVSDTVGSVDLNGVKDEYQYQVMKGMREVARNIERALFKTELEAGATAGAIGTSSTYRMMKSLIAFCSGATTTYAGATGLITTAHVNNMMEIAYTNGSNPDTLWVSPGVKADFSVATISSSFSRNLQAADKKLVLNVDVYESDFGLLAIVPDRFIPQAAVSATQTNIFITERSKNRIAFLRPIRHVPLAKAGDATRGFIVGELTLEVLHPLANCRASGITT